MITVYDCEYSKFKFPCGELQVKIRPLYMKSVKAMVDIRLDFEGSDDIIELLLINNALKRQGRKIGYLSIPYVPFSRQDRINSFGESLSIEVFADIVNSIGAESVLIDDPHSDVTTALIKNCEVTTQDAIARNYLDGKSDFWLISPDGGALKKIYKLASKVNTLGVVECSKKRDTKTGEISGVIVHAEDLQGRECVIVDDICDGGRTFIEIAKELKKRNCGKIILMVTHGFFTKGLEVFDGLIDEIHTRKGRVK